MKFSSGRQNWNRKILSFSRVPIVLLLRYLNKSVALNLIQFLKCKSTQQVCHGNGPFSCLFITQLYLSMYSNSNLSNCFQYFGHRHHGHHGLILKICWLSIYSLCQWFKLNFVNIFVTYFITKNFWHQLQKRTKLKIYFSFLLLNTLFSLFKQYVTEKMGGAEGTKLDLDFMEMERVRWWQLADDL